MARNAVVLLPLSQYTTQDLNIFLKTFIQSIKIKHLSFVQLNIEIIILNNFLFSNKKDFSDSYFLQNHNSCFIIEDRK